MSMRASIMDLLTPKSTKTSCFPRGSVQIKGKGAVCRDVILPQSSLL